MVLTTTHVVFVQFPHPKDEHNPRGAKRQPWNRRNHARKFLRCDGRYVDHDGSTHNAPLVFWGEWEAPSYVIACWPQNGDLPRFLHDPVWEFATDSDPRQNTDPWVFGDCFRYSNCKQLSQRGLRALPRSSVILFGSTPGGSFVVDTVFVVRDAQRLVPKQPPQLDEIFRVCTVEPLSLDGECSGEEFVLYRGATFDDPVEGMYSFVPARRADREEPRFSRPRVTLARDFLNPTSRQSPNGANRLRPIDQIREQWESVRNQVIEAHRLLGVWFSTPRLDNGQPLAN